GWVQNSKGQVIIHAQSSESGIEKFIHQLLHHAPDIARPVLQDKQLIPVEDINDFSIQASNNVNEPVIHTPPDYTLCPNCLLELNDPGNRRYHYPFINCTQCGPRYTIIKNLPYDRANTSMAGFTLCTECKKEYDNPLDRRFHAEPVACETCGPRLFYVEADYHTDITETALAKTITALRSGRIIAIKGIGGYHLICDATNDQAVQTLRERKSRPDKPFAVMFPVNGINRGHADLDILHQHALVDEASARLLQSPARPIVLLDLKKENTLSRYVAPGIKQVGAILPYSPLHYLLLQEFNAPLVATSANISGEPVLTHNKEVEQRLSHIADAFLHHDREIIRPADDSVYRLINNKPAAIRLGRGNSPLELDLPFRVDRPVLAVGGQMKNTIALAWDKRMLISPHIGDLGSARSMKIFEQVIHDLQQLYEVEAEVIACDAHPDYQSHRWASQYARNTGKRLFSVYHHHAHASAIALEHYHQQPHRPWLVFTWDGTGYGEDGSLWGGETFYGRPNEWKRMASFKPFYLPGSDKAGREPWRSAAALCWQSNIDYQASINENNFNMVKLAWQKRINCPTTTSVGRLFDAAACLAGLLDTGSFEGQGPMQFEACIDNATGSPGQTTGSLPVQLNADNILEADWKNLIPLLQDTELSLHQKSIEFHNIMAATALKQALLLKEQLGDFVIGLSGGVFQNKYLTEQIIYLLQQNNFTVYTNHLIPCNDGGISAGQIMEVIKRLDS
ncbi:MAG: carbamoyltransferase HypF, partial [Gammaproteobacteria bacterium]|nr:carbamoyltransferase HypF [Gammaproteobacteria bacterium]